MEQYLESVWQNLAFSYTGDVEVIGKLWKEVELHYTEPNRAYHNLLHLRFLVDNIRLNQAHISNPHALLFAAFYHDVIYDVTQKDNEIVSSALAESRLKELDVDQSVIALASAIILQTTSHEKTGIFDIDLFLDFDRLVLGASEEEYAVYAAGIRAEYSIFSDSIYSTLRSRVLAKFLALPELYYTGIGKPYEVAARRNMNNELQRMIR